MFILLLMYRLSIHLFLGCVTSKSNLCVLVSLAGTGPNFSFWASCWGGVIENESLQYVLKMSSLRPLPECSQKEHQNTMRPQMNHHDPPCPQIEPWASSSPQSGGANQIMFVHVYGTQDGFYSKWTPCTLPNIIVHTVQAICAVSSRPRASTHP